MALTVCYIGLVEMDNLDLSILSFSVGVIVVIYSMAFDLDRIPMFPVMTEDEVLSKKSDLSIEEYPQAIVTDSELVSSMPEIDEETRNHVFIEIPDPMADVVEPESVAERRQELRDRLISGRR